MFKYTWLIVTQDVNKQIGIKIEVYIIKINEIPSIPKPNTKFKFGNH